MGTLTLVGEGAGGDEYSGEFTHNLPQTYADVCCRMLTYASAFMLTCESSGEFAHNLPHGKGVMLWPNASRYEGERKRGKSARHRVVTAYRLLYICLTYSYICV